MRIGRKVKLCKPLKRQSGGPGVAQTLLDPIVPLEKAWAMGGSKVIKAIEGKNGCSGMAQILLEPIGALEVIWALRRR